MELEKTRLRTYVLIDDDQNYRSIMSKYAKKNGVHLETYSSLSELGSIGNLARYDGAIIDYELEELSGVDIAEYVSILYWDLPVTLVSEKQRRPDTKVWPDSIKCFFEKSHGCENILKHVST